MRIRILAVATMAAGMGVWAGDLTPDSDRTVTVCMHGGGDGLAEYMAQAEASRIFEKIGIRIVWRNPRSPEAFDGSVIVSFSYRTLPTDHPGALAYALPYEGTHIVVFYDRVREIADQARTAHLLAYVLVHEITHILQGVTRHSDTGIMKAHWNSGDYFEMGRGTLVFAPEDLRILSLNLDARNVRAGSAARAGE
jgi:hypothetical protein